MKTLASIAAATGSAISTPAFNERIIQRVSALSNAGPDTLVFIEDAALIEIALASGAGAILAPVEALSSQATGSVIPILVSSNPRLAFARAAGFLSPPSIRGIVHPTAVIDKPELLGRGVTVGPHAVIKSAAIGDNSNIGAGCFIADSVTIGADCVLHPHVTIYAGTTIGDRVLIHAGAVLGADGFGYVRDPTTGRYIQFPQQGTLLIEDDVEIGANSTIDRGALEVTRIGRGTKLDNLVHVGHNCDIGANVVIASQTGISGSCVIGDGAILGGQVGMGDHVTIGDGVILGGGAGILPHKKLHGLNQVFWGTPARPLKQYLRELATVARLGRRASVKKDEGK